MESNTNRLIVLYLLHKGYMSSVEISDISGISHSYVRKIKSVDFRNDKSQKARIFHEAKMLKDILSTVAKEETQ